MIVLFDTLTVTFFYVLEHYIHNLLGKNVQWNVLLVTLPVSAITGLLAFGIRIMARAGSVM